MLCTLFPCNNSTPPQVNKSSRLTGQQSEHADVTSRNLDKLCPHSLRVCAARMCERSDRNAPLDLVRIGACQLDGCAIRLHEHTISQA